VSRCVKLRAPDSRRVESRVFTRATPGTSIAQLRVMSSTMTRSTPVETWLRLIQAEYLEMPGLHLTRPQIQRLWHLDDLACDLLLDRLVTDRFLRQTSHGAYVLDRN
jgi:hypothetical protein